MTPGCLAAVEVGHLLDVHSAEPVVIQETNNTVVWLRPHPVIAKVGTRIDRVEGLVREHQVATSLSALGAPVAEPLSGTGPIRSPSTGFVVTLWHRLERDPGADMSGAMVAQSLRQLHEALAAVGIPPPLPDFRLAPPGPRCLVR